MLVGYSWGGTLARYFAGLHPDAVAGIVYVDPGPVVTQTLAEELDLLDESGSGTAGRDSLMARVGHLLHEPAHRSSGVTDRTGLMGTALLALSLGGCAGDAGGAIRASAQELGPASPVAIVRTSSLKWEGEQAYIPLYADGTASGLVVVNFAGGQLYGTSIPDSWSWLGADTVEICTSVPLVARPSLDEMVSFP